MIWGINGQVSQKNKSHAHDMHEFLICMNDGGKQVIGDTCHNFIAGRPFLLYGRCSHYIEASLERPAEYTFLCFDPSHFLNRQQLDIHHLVRELERGSVFTVDDDADYFGRNIRIAIDIQDELNTAKPYAAERLNSFLSDLLITFYRQAKHYSDKAVSEDNALLDRLCQKISRDPSFGLDLVAAAKSVSMGKTKFSQAFKQHTGMSYVEFIQWTRVKRAIDLFLTTDLSVSEVAAEAGFNNLGYFHRLFRNFTSMTPRQLKTYIYQRGSIPHILNLT